MQNLPEIFQTGFSYLFTQEALPHITLLIAIFAILNLNDFKRGIILILSFGAGFLVNLLLLSFKIFSVQDEYWRLLILMSTLLFALWNFGYNSSGYSRKKGSNLSSRYLIVFLLGVLNGIYIYFAKESLLTQNEFLIVIIFWLGIFLALLIYLIADFVILWVLSNFFRLKEEAWHLVVNGITIGFIIGVYLT